MLSGINPSISDEINRQSSAIAKRREQLRRWDESETNRESTKMKLSQRVKFEQAYIFLAACAAEDRDEIDKLLQRGVDINTSNIDGLTALHQSCIDNNFNMVEYLLKKNADINCQDNEGWTPLHAATSCGNLDIVKYLLSHGAIVDACNNEGELAIDIAEDEDILALLEDDMKRKGIDDQQSRNYEHQLMIKHAQDLLNHFKNGLKSSADAIVHNRTGATALHVAAAKGYFDVIELLIRAGANVNAIDNDGWTPLHAAAHWDKHDVIKYLIEKHADLDVKNYAGQTPFDVCDADTFQLLKELKEKYPPPMKNKPIVTKPSPVIPDDHLKEKLNNLQRSLDDLSNRYTKKNEEESNSFQEKNFSSLSNSSQRIFTNPLQSLTTPNFHLNRDNSNPTLVVSSQSSDSKINQRWGTTDRTIPYVRRCSNVNESSNRDEEAEAQRKHRSAQARRERRSTQSVTVEDIKAAEQQMKNRSNELSNNQIGAPSTPLANHEHDIETERLQQYIEDKKDQIRFEITANDSLNLPENQQQRRKTNRINNQRKNTGRIIWNDQTKEIEIRDDRNVISRFDNHSLNNGIKNYQSIEDIQKKIEVFNEKIIKLEKDILDRDQIIDKLKTSQLIESSFDRREKRSYERKISELEEELKKFDSIKSDNTRLKEENAALIRVISKLSK